MAPDATPRLLNYPDLQLFRGAGAIHGSEIPYVFGLPPAGAAAADKQMSDTVMAYWTNFAKIADPNGSGPPAWPAYSAVDPQAMRLDAPSAAIA